MADESNWVQILGALGMSGAFATAVAHLLNRQDTEKKRLHAEIAALQATIDRHLADIAQKSSEIKQSAADGIVESARIVQLEDCIAGLRGIAVRHNVELFILRKDRKETLEEAERALAASDPAECCRILAVICKRLEKEIEVPELG